MTYKYINIVPKSELLNAVIDANSTYSLGVNEETLIAMSAPHLLEALKDCIDALRIHAPDAWALEQANKAILKSEGKL